jgi:hypothetical protein
MREKAERAESIVERYDDSALLREGRTVVALFTAEPSEETAPVNPHKYGTRGAGRGNRE